MVGENPKNPDGLSNGTPTGVDEEKEALADDFLKQHGYDENGYNEEQRNEIEEAEKKWQAMGLEQTVKNNSRGIAERAYDNMPGPDSPDESGREYQINPLQTQVENSAPEIAEKAYDRMSPLDIETVSLSELGENEHPVDYYKKGNEVEDADADSFGDAQKEVGPSSENAQKTGTDDEEQ